MRPRRVAPWEVRAWELILPRLPVAVIRFLIRAVFRLPRGSRLRDWWIWGTVVLVWRATEQERLEIVLRFWDQDAEWRWDENFLALGFDELYRGHDGVRRGLMNWNRTWTEVGFEVREILDGGDTLLMRMRGTGRGASSGVPTQMDVSSVARFDPLIVEFDNFVDDAEALRKAGFASTRRGP